MVVTDNHDATDDSKDVSISLCRTHQQTKEWNTEAHKEVTQEIGFVIFKTNLVVSHFLWDLCIPNQQILR